MKFVITTVLVLIGTVSSSAFAAEACVQVPDEGVKYQKMNVNFDGSVTVSVPTVYVNGQFMEIWGKESGAQGFCELLGKKLATYHTKIAGTKEFASLNPNGTLSSTVNAEWLGLFSLDEITCR